MSPKLVVAVISTCCLFAQTDWRHADPNSNLIAGLNWRSIQASPLAPLLRSQFLRNPVATSLMTTFDLVDTVTWSSTATQQDGHTTTEWVVALTGAFDLDVLTSQLADLGYTAQAYRSITLLIPARPSSKRVQLALLDARTIVVADAGPLRRAVDRIFDSPARYNPLFAQALQLEQTHDLWLAGTGSPMIFYRKRIPDIVAGLPAVQSYTMGLDLRDAPVLRLGLAASSAPEAEVFAQLMSVLPYVVKLRPEERQVVQDIWAKAKFTPEAEIARAVLPLDLLLQAIVP